MKPISTNKIPFYVIALVVGAFVAYLLSRPAHAGDAELTWVHPTTYTDGTPLPLTEIARTEVEYGKCNSGKTGFLTTPVPVIVAVVPPPAITTITGLTVGAWCFRARTVDNTGGDFSAWTPFVSKTFVAPAPTVPNPPTGLTVTPGNLTAYTVVKRRDGFVMLPVGVVPADTRCDASQSVNGYNVVPRASVAWAGSVQPEVVVASCV